MRVKLIRTETLAQGGQKCDFRFCRGHALETTPEFLNS